jgi:hypothetical protein
MCKTTIKDKHVICKCGRDLGEVENSKGYLCKSCEIVYFTSENAINLLEELEKGTLKNNVLDWLK